MKHYMICTAQGGTNTPNGTPMENLQVLGWEDAETPAEALSRFKHSDEGGSCMNAGFDLNDVVLYELVSTRHLSGVGA